MKIQKSQKQKIAFCGTRGLPARYGGFETAVDQISLRFIQEGYEVDIFCRKSNNTIAQKDRLDGRKLLYVNGSSSRKLDTFIASIEMGWYIFKNRNQYAHAFWFNNANLPGILMTFLSGVPISVNVDGLEWRRAKWPFPFKVYYVLSSVLICLFCKRLIADSLAIQSYYKKRFYKRSTFIPYGVPDSVNINQKKQDEVLKKLGLESGRYFLQITRLEPDNVPDLVVRSFQKCEEVQRAGYKLILVGYKESNLFADALKNVSGKHGVNVLDAIYDPVRLAVLRRNCFSYVHGNSVGGTNPALLEAMASCPRVMAINNEFSREVLGDTGVYFNSENLPTVFSDVLKREDNSVALKKRVNEKYDWESVSRGYMNLVDSQHNYKLSSKSQILDGIQK